MNTRISVQLGDVGATLTLFDELAPLAAHKLLGVLPIDAELRHVRWSGETGYFLLASLAEPGAQLENAVTFYPRGSLIYRPEHGEFAFTYGQAQARDNVKLADHACLLGALEENAEPFLELVRKTRTEGRQPLRLSGS